MNDTKLTREDALINGSRQSGNIRFDDMIDYLIAREGPICYGGYVRAVKNRLAVAETMGTTERLQFPYVY